MLCNLKFLTNKKIPNKKIIIKIKGLNKSVNIITPINFV